MEQSVIVFEDPLKACGFTIIPIVRIVRNHVGWDDWAASCFMNKEPVAIVVLQSEMCTIFNKKGGEMSLEDFKNAFPGMADAFLSDLSVFSAAGTTDS